jgi:hypothetical protein
MHDVRSIGVGKSAPIECWRVRIRELTDRGAQLPPVAHDHRALDEVLQLSDIPRPRVADHREPGEVIEVSRDQFLTLVQTDAELSEILMRSFILRRLELIARDLGDVVVIGSAYTPGTLRVKEFLTRNGHPLHYVDLDRDHTAQELLHRFRITVDDVPVVICTGGSVLRNRSQPFESPQTGGRRWTRAIGRHSASDVFPNWLIQEAA